MSQKKKNGEDDKNEEEQEKAVPIPTESIQKPIVKEKEPTVEIKKKSSTDLFNAHNFDITIDLEVPITSKFLIRSLNSL